MKILESLKMMWNVRVVNNAVGLNFIKDIIVEIITEMLINQNIM